MDDLPFVITLVRSGGFAGIRREWSIEVVAADEAEYWCPIIEACPWSDVTGDGNPDGYVYDFRVADHEAVVPERELDGPWRELAEQVRRHAGQP
jgi:hypothetical protein